MITFEHPIITPTLTVTMRNPQLGDGEQTNTKTTLGRARSGLVWTYIYTPVGTLLLRSFVGIPQTDIDSFEALIDAASGGQLDYTDHDGTVYRGRFVSNPLQFTTELDDCSISFNMQFEVDEIV
tara:strand:+ start:82 stop:453 length:372 start_codon:yes stop_codon:yes gene_type:complete